MKTKSKPRFKQTVLMTVSTVNDADVSAIKKLIKAGMEVVVVQDKDFDKALRVFKKLGNRKAKCATKA